MKHRRLLAATAAFAVLLAIFWRVARHFHVDATVGGHLDSAFASFALVLAPVWLMGFGALEPLRSLTRRSWAGAVLLPAALGIPPLVFALPLGWPHPDLLIAMFLFPVATAALLRTLPAGARLAWQDVAVMAALAAAHLMRVFEPAWPYPGLGSLSKLWLVDVALFAFLVARDLEGAGYSLVPAADDFARGLKEWLFFAPIAVALGSAVHFIRFQRYLPSMGEVLAGTCATFFLIAVPEEIFFRGVLQNLLETRLGRIGGLVLASLLFGLSHFDKPAPFNWRYVMLASIAGFFYGRAWRRRRRLFASAVTHTAVDVVWSLWFRIPGV